MDETEQIPFSILDLAPIVEGSTASTALANSLAIAQRAEDWGYRRFWLVEHHNFEGIALYDHEEPDSVTENWLKQLQGQTLLIAGHSDTTPLFANALMGHEYFQEKFDESDFGNLVIITVAADRNSSQLLHLRY